MHSITLIYDCFYNSYKVHNTMQLSREKAIIKCTFSLLPANKFFQSAVWWLNVIAKYVINIWNFLIINLTFTLTCKIKSHRARCLKFLQHFTRPVRREVLFTSGINGCKILPRLKHQWTLLSVAYSMEERKKNVRWFL